jgi:hypothetical protein
MTRDPKHSPIDPTHWDEFAVILDTPERRLMWAVLGRAIFDRIGAASKEDRRTSRRYFDDKAKDRAHLYSFSSIAEYLSNDSEAFKRGIRRFIGDELDAKLVRRGPRPRTVKLQ